MVDAVILVTVEEEDRFRPPIMEDPPTDEALDFGRPPTCLSTRLLLRSNCSVHVRKSSIAEVE